MFDIYPGTLQVLTLKLIWAAISAASLCVSSDFALEVSLGRILLLGTSHSLHFHS